MNVRTENLYKVGTAVTFISAAGNHCQALVISSQGSLSQVKMGSLKFFISTARLNFSKCAAPAPVDPQILKNIQRAERLKADRRERANTARPNRVAPWRKRDEARADAARMFDVADCDVNRVNPERLTMKGGDGPFAALASLIG